MISCVGVPGCASVCLTCRSSPDIDTAKTTAVTHDADTGKVTSAPGKKPIILLTLLKAKKYID